METCEERSNAGMRWIRHDKVSRVCPGIKGKTSKKFQQKNASLEVRSIWRRTAEFSSDSESDSHLGFGFPINLCVCRLQLIPARCSSQSCLLTRSAMTTALQCAALPLSRRKLLCSVLPCSATPRPRGRSRTQQITYHSRPPVRTSGWSTASCLWTLGGSTFFRPALYAPTTLQASRPRSARSSASPTGSFPSGCGNNTYDQHYLAPPPTGRCS